MQPILVNILYNIKHNNKKNQIGNSNPIHDSKTKNEKKKRHTNDLQKELELNPFFLSF